LTEIGWWACQVVPGQTTDTFRRQPLPQWAHLSFSLLYRSSEDGQPRTLDLICKSDTEYELWYFGLQVDTPPSLLCSLQSPQPPKPRQKEAGEMKECNQ
jgi:hypothetical protein